MEPEELFLKPDELMRLTGYSQPSKQVSHLEAMGIPYVPNGLKQPVVLRETIKNLLSLNTGKRSGKPKPSPDFDNL